MTEKAMVGGAYDIRQEDGVYTMAVSIVMTNGTSSTAFTVYPTASSFNPLIPNWRSRIAQAAKDYALATYSITIDQVMFPDYGVLGL